MKLQETWPQGSKAAAKTIVKCEEEITMKPYREMSKEELASLKEQLEKVYKEYHPSSGQKPEIEHGPRKAKPGAA